MQKRAEGAGDVGGQGADRSGRGQSGAGEGSEAERPRRSPAGRAEAGSGSRAGPGQQTQAAQRRAAHGAVGLGVAPERRSSGPLGPLRGRGAEHPPARPGLGPGLPGPGQRDLQKSGGLVRGGVGRGGATPRSEGDVEQQTGWGRRGWAHRCRPGRPGASSRVPVIPHQDLHGHLGGGLRSQGRAGLLLVRGASQGRCRPPESRSAGPFVPPPCDLPARVRMGSQPSPQGAPPVPPVLGAEAGAGAPSSAWERSWLRRGRL